MKIRSKVTWLKGIIKGTDGDWKLRAVFSYETHGMEAPGSCYFKNVSINGAWSGVEAAVDREGVFTFGVDAGYADRAQNCSGREMAFLERVCVAQWKLCTQDIGAMYAANNQRGKDATVTFPPISTGSSAPTITLTAGKLDRHLKRSDKA